MFLSAQQIHALRHSVGVIANAHQILVKDHPELAEDNWIEMIGRNAQDLLDLVTELEKSQ